MGSTTSGIGELRFWVPILACLVTQTEILNYLSQPWYTRCEHEHLPSKYPRGMLSWVTIFTNLLASCRWSWILCCTGSHSICSDNYSAWRNFQVRLTYRHYWVHRETNSGTLTCSCARKKILVKWFYIGHPLESENVQKRSILINVTKCPVKSKQSEPPIFNNRVCVWVHFSKVRVSVSVYVYFRRRVRETLNCLYFMQIVMERMKGHKKVKGYFVTLSKITSNWLKKESKAIRQTPTSPVVTNDHNHVTRVMWQP